MSWIMTGPIVGKVLGDYGASVVKVESHRRPDPTRVGSPFAQRKSGINRSGQFGQFNTSKYDITLNLEKSEGIKVLERLILWADIIIESFTPGQMAKWGLAYENVRQIKSDIIMLSISIQGQTGPYAKQAGFGSYFQGMTGFSYLTGWPNQIPILTYTPYPDFVTPWYSLVAVIAALDNKRQTGEGQWIDVSQLETTAQFLAPAILDYAANHRVQARVGNRLGYACPHGVYKCKGEDNWCAITVFNDKEWASLCNVIDMSELERNPRFTTLLGRKKNEDELDQLIQSWTISHSPKEVESIMQRYGVPAAVVNDNQDLCEDPNFKERSFIEVLSHPEMGQCSFMRPSFILHETPPEMRRPPLLGEHTEWVCTHILGMSDGEFVKLMEAGAFD